MSLAEGMTPADIGAVMGNRDNDCWGWKWCLLDYYLILVCLYGKRILRK